MALVAVLTEEAKYLWRDLNFVCLSPFNWDWSLSVAGDTVALSVCNWMDNINQAFSSCLYGDNGRFLRIALLCTILPLLLLCSAFIGGCAGSTGGIKVDFVF